MVYVYKELYVILKDQAEMRLDLSMFTKRIQCLKIMSILNISANEVCLNKELLKELKKHILGKENVYSFC